MKKLLHGLFALLLISSCKSETACNNTNPVFNQSDYNDPAYKSALKDSLAAIPARELKYTLSGFLERDGKEYIIVNIRHDEHFCVIAPLLLGEEEALREIRKKKGMGYRGAELCGLEIKTLEYPQGIQFEVLRLDKIVD